MESAEIHILHCGQGDTILLRLPASYWILIDCNLPSDVAVQSFLAKTTELGISRLDAVILTHPDRDHYRGMRQVLEYFSTTPRSIGFFYDSGFTQKLARAASEAGRELDRELLFLFRAVVALHKQERLTYRSLYRGWQPEEPSPPAWKKILVPVSPTVAAVNLSNLQAIVGTERRGANEYSLVFFIHLAGACDSLTALFTGDAGGETLQAALRDVQQLTQGLKIDFAKIAHHGSWHSHLGSPVCAAIRIPGKSVAVVSTCSRSTELPRREVLQAYLGSKWRVYDTGRRGESEAVGLVHAVAWRESVEAKHDIVVSWNEGDGISAHPQDAEVAEEHLYLYPSGAAQSDTAR